MSRQTVLNTAEAEDGYEEYPENSNKTKFGEWYGLNGERWCAIFVSWVFYNAGHPLGHIDKAKGFHSCKSGYNFWKSRDLIVKNPEPGDIVLYDFNKGSGPITDHTGIFVEWIVRGRTFRAWEGNTKDTGDTDGGHVMLRERDFRSVFEFVDPGVY